MYFPVICLVIATILLGLAAIWYWRAPAPEGWHWRLFFVGMFLFVLSFCWTAVGGIKF